jgi:hypothetical protein
MQIIFTERFNQSLTQRSRLTDVNNVSKACYHFCFGCKKKKTDASNKESNHPNKQKVKRINKRYGRLKFGQGRNVHYA